MIYKEEPNDSRDEECAINNFAYTFRGIREHYNPLEN